MKKKPSAKALAADAVQAETPERKLAALITLEAVQPEALLSDPETLVAVAENVDGPALADELDDIADSASGSTTRK